jgi:hypothetical protein
MLPGSGEQRCLIEVDVWGPWWYNNAPASSGVHGRYRRLALSGALRHDRRYHPAGWC